MKTRLLTIALAALTVGLLTSCKKDKGPEGQTDFAPEGCEAVDLGLSVKWASFNVGATNDHDYGSYFAWGETSGKAEYLDSNYKWGKQDSKQQTWGMTKYTGDVKGGDGLYTLRPEDDAAIVNWGTRWRTPTLTEFKELHEKCNWTWDETRVGYVVEGSTGNSIFLSAAGYRIENLRSEGHCLYWSSSLYGSVVCGAMDSDDDKVHDTNRYYGMPVRAVTEY